MSERFIRMVDCELEEPLTLEAVADAVGVRPPLLARLIRLGVLESVGNEVDEPLLPTRAVISLRRMARLRRDLGVNFAGAAIILELVDRIEGLNHEVAELRQRLED
ncbi:MAG TPA: chaperone modulator CbpM [Pyrinomonadaceae bacterium]|nr:chaperone modulator CbpM [Pyrinomonadaceae bacterium]